MKNKFEYDDWMMFVDVETSSVKVVKDGESRRYHLGNKIVNTIQEGEYVDIHVENGNFYSFKFEIDDALIADIYDSNEEFVDTFACYYFGEENYEL